MARPMPGMAIIGEHTGRETLSDLAPGDYAYVSPAALIVTANRVCHIQTDVPVRRTPDETASMQVRRTADGYVADVTYCRFQWTPTDVPDDVPHAPIVHVVFGDEFLQ